MKSVKCSDGMSNSVNPDQPDPSGMADSVNPDQPAPSGAG